MFLGGSTTGEALFLMSEAVTSSRPLTKAQREIIAGEKRAAMLGNQDSLEVRLINALMLSRNLDARMMDEKCGFEPGTFSALRSKDFSGEGTRAKVERAFSCRVWCDEHTWHLREACFRRFGFDPSILQRSELKEWIDRLDIRHRVPPSADRAALVQTVLNFLAANPKD